MHDGLCARHQHGAIRLTHRNLDVHRGRIEHLQERTARPQLIALLRVPQGVVPPYVRERHHTADWRFHQQLLGVSLLARDGNLLAVALQLQNAKFGLLRKIVGLVGPFQTRDVLPRIGDLYLVSLLFDGAQDGPLTRLDLSLLEIGPGLLKVGDALLGVTQVLSFLLLDLMLQIVELGLGVAEDFELVGAVESGQRIANGNGGAVFREGRERQISALTLDPGHHHSDRVHGANDAGRANGTARRYGRRSIESGGGDDQRTDKGARSQG